MLVGQFTPCGFNICGVMLVKRDDVPQARSLWWVDQHYPTLIQWTQQSLHLLKILVLRVVENLLAIATFVEKIHAVDVLT